MDSERWLKQNHAVVAQSFLFRRAACAGYSARHNPPEFFFSTGL